MKNHFFLRSFFMFKSLETFFLSVQHNYNIKSKYNYIILLRINNSTTLCNTKIEEKSMYKVNKK